MAVSVSAAAVGFTSTAITVGTRGMAQELDLGLESLGWVVNGFLLAAAATALLGGRLGDRIGRTNTMMVGACVFGLASALGAVAPGSTALTIARFVQGIGAGLLMPSGVEVLVAFSRPTKASEAFAIRSGLYAVSFAIGPLVGGLLTDYVSWRWIFVGDLVLMGFVIVIASPLLRYRTRLPRGRWHDWSGAGLFAAIVFLVVLVADRSRVWGWASVLTGGVVVLIAVLVIVFVVVERRTQARVFHPSLLRNRRVLGANIATFGASLGMIGLLYFFNAFAQSAATFDSGAVQVLIAFVPFIASVVLVTVISLGLKRWLGYRGPALVGMGCMVVGFAMLGFTDGNTTRPELWVPLILCGLGAGISNVGLSSAAIMGLPAGRLNEAAGLVSLSRFLGSALALAVGTNTYLAVRAHSDADSVVGARPKLIDLLLGGDAYNKAVQRLGEDLRGPFEAIVRDETAAAFAATMRVSALVVGLTWVASLVLLRNPSSAESAWVATHEEFPDLDVVDRDPSG